MPEFYKTNNATGFSKKVKTFAVVIIATLLSVTAKANTYTPTTFTDPIFTTVNNANGVITGGAGIGLVSLRSALKAADNLGGTHTVNLSTGNYILDGTGTYTYAGPTTVTLRTILLGITSQNITINGNGPLNTFITMAVAGQDRMFLINPDGTTNSPVISMSGITFQNANLTSDNFGGAAIYAGGGSAESLTLTNCAFLNNTLTAGNGGGAAVKMDVRGNLTIDNCTFTNNISNDADGGAVLDIIYNSSLGTGFGTLNVTNSTFTGNSVNVTGASNANGGALEVSGQGGVSAFNATITNNTFINNTADGLGGALVTNNGPNLSILQVHFNRFLGNTAAAGAASNALHFVESSGSVNADNNWWGCNTGPAAGPCDRAGGDVAGGGTLTLTKWLQLKTTASTNPICNTAPSTPTNTSNITTSFLSNSASEAVTAANISRLIGLPVTWTSTLGSLSGQQATIQAAGTATATFTSNGTAGTATVNAQVDNVPAAEISPARASITVNAASVAPTGATGGTTVCSGGSVTLTVTGGIKGSGASTQWFTGSCGGTLVFTGDALNTGALVATTTYFVRYNGTCNTTTCATVTVTVNDVTSGTTGSDQTICSGGDPAAFTESVASTGSGALTYQWQSSTTSCAAGFSPIGGATSITYDPPSGLGVTTYYRRYTISTLGGVPCTAPGNCITVTVNNVTGGTVGSDQSVISGGDPAAFTQSVASTGSGALTYQWQSSTTSCAAGFSDIGGATATTYDPPAGLLVTTYYRRVTTSTLAGVPCTANSNCITVTVTCGILETFESFLLGSTGFTSGGVPFTLTPNPKFVVASIAPGTGYLSSDKYIDNIPLASPAGNTNPCQIKSAATYKVKSLYLYPSNLPTGNINQTAGVVVTFTGKLGGITQFTYTPPAADFAAANWADPINRGFSLVNFATPGFDNTLIDELVITLGGTTVYFAIDNFTFCPPPCTPSSITLGASPTVCRGTTSASLPYTATTGSPDTYSIDYDVAANAAGFVDVVNAALPVSPITLTVPGAAAGGTYNATITVIKTAGGCVSPAVPFTVSVNDVTGGTVATDQTICSGGDPALFTQTVASTGTGALTYQWQSNTTSCVAAFTNIAGATSATYDAPSGLTQTTYYRRVTTSTLNAVACTANSNCITVTVNDVTGGTVAADQTICSGGDPALFTQTVASTGSGALTYQWQSNTTSCVAAFTNIAGATSSTYDAPSGLTQTTYYRRVTTSTLNAVACTANSNCITVTVNNVTGGTVAADQTICSGGDPALFTQTVASTGSGALTYQWQSNTTSCVAAFTNIAGATGTTYDPPSGLTQTTYYRRVTTSTLNAVACTANSNCITVTVNDVTGGTVAADQTICSGGDPALFTQTVASTGSGALTYQWQSNTTSCVAAFTNIAGATSSTYDAPSGLTQTTYYRRVTSSTLNAVACTANSNCITVTVNNVTGGTVAADQTICSGGDPALFTETVASTGSGALTYQWQSNTTSCVAAFTNIAGATGTTYDAPSGLTQTTYYRRVTTSTLNAVACTANSNCITVTVNNVTGGTVAADQTICSGGDPAAFTQTVASTGSGALTYQWQSNTTSCVAAFTNIAGATGITYDAPLGLTQTTYYRRVTTSTLNAVACTANSNCVTVTVNPIPDAVATPASQAICSGSAITTIALTGSVPGTVFNWTRDNTVTVTGIANSGAGNIAGSLTNTTNAPITVTFTITPSYTNAGVTCTGTPITATVTVNPIPDVNQPADQVICNGTLTAPVNFTGSVAGTNFNWTNNTPSIGLAGSGSGNIASFVATNATNAPVVATVTVTPSTGIGAADQSQLVNTSCMATFNQTNLAQSFKPAASLICGARIFIRSGGGSGDITIQLYSNLPNAAGILMAQGTVNGISAGQWALVGWPGVAVTPGNTYYLVFTSTNGNLCIGGSVSNPYPNGQVYANAGYQSFPGFDYTFETFSCGIVCTGPSKTFTYTVNPTPNAVATPSSQTICSGSAITTIALTGNVVGTVFNWTRDNTVSVTGIANSGAGDISGSLTNTTNAPVTVTFTITPSYTNAGVSCTGTPITATVVVNPIPNAVATPSSQTICSGSAITPINLSGNVIGTVFNWVRDNTVSVTGIANSGSGNISGSLTNTTNTPITVTFTITPSFTNAGVTCTGPSITATVVVNPIPDAVATPSAQTICSGSAITTINLTGSVPGTVFSWIRDNNGTAIGIASSGSGLAFIIGSLTNLTNAPVTVTFTITPSYTNGGTTCTGPSITATVIVNPIPNAAATPAAQTICSGTAITTIVNSGNVVGTVFNWTRDNTGSVTGIAGSGSGNISGSLTNTTNASVTVTFTITPSYTNAGVTCTGAPVTATVLVNPTPNAVATPSAQTICSGSLITNIILTGNVAGTSFNWTRNNTGTVTGIAANGTGDIGGSLTNTTNAPVTVTFTIIPTANGCPGPSITATVVVNPIPNAVATPASQTICSGNNITTIVNSGNVAGTVYNWTRNNTGTVIGIAGSGSGNISGSLTNTTNTPVTVTFTITPSYTNAGVTCTGAPTTATVLVNPTPNAVATPASQTICSGSAITTIVLTGAVSGTTFNWTRDNTVAVTGIAAGGSGNISGTLTNTTNGPVTVTFTITPTANGCPGTPITATVVVNPIPNAIAAPSSQTICSGNAITTIALSGNVAGTVYNWTRDNIVAVTGIAGSGSGNISGILTNTTTSPVTVTFTITPSYTNGGVTCTGTPITATVLVNPIPNAVATPVNQTICSGGTITTIALTGAVSGTTFNWTRDNTVAVTGIAASGSGNINGALTNTTNAPVTVTFTITPVANGCPGASVTAAVVVNPIPNAVATPASQTICSGSAITTIALSGNVAGTVFNWSRDNTLTVTGMPNGGTGNISGSLTNTTNAPVLVTFTVTPVYSNGGITCTGTPITATVLVNPTPNAVAIPSAQTICSGNSITTIVLSGNVSGTTFNWTRDNTVIVTGIAVSGSGNISGSLTNTTNAPVTVTFTITPTANGCPGTPVTATVLVNPTPNAVATPASQTICSGNAITTIALTSAVAGTTYNWTRDNVTTVAGIPGFGSGNISGILTNNTTGPLTITFTITPTANGCAGIPITATVIVNPTPTIVCPANIVVNAVTGTCGADVNYPAAIATGTPAPTITYSKASGTNFPVGVTIVTATASNICGTVSCTFTVTVIDVRIPVVTTQPTNTAVCVGKNSIFSVVATNATSYQWQTGNANNQWGNIPGATSSSYTTNNTNMFMNGALYRVAITGPCGTVVYSNPVTLTVYPLPLINLSSATTPELVPGRSVTITSTAVPPGGTYAWLFNGNPITGAAAPTLGPLYVDNIGRYNVIYTDLNGCVSTSADFLVSGEISDNLYVYPNPNQGQFHVRFFNQFNEQVTVRVFDMKGAEVYLQKAITTLAYSNINVDLSGNHITAGETYVVEVRGNQERLIGSKKIVVIK